MGRQDSRQWVNLCGAVLRGIAANHNNVDFVLHYKYQHANQGLMSQLLHKWLKNFEVVQRRKESYFISKPPTPTGEVVCVVCQSLCTVQVTIIFVHRNTCEGLNVLACTHPLRGVHVCMQYSCTCVHAVLMYMCACSTHVHVCMQYSCHVCMQYSCHVCMQYSCHVCMQYSCHVCMQYSCTCVHAVLMYMCACSTHVMCACSTHVHVCMQYSCHVSCEGNLVR